MRVSSFHQKERKSKKKNGHMIKCLLTESGRTGREIFGSRSGRTDLVLGLNVLTSIQIFSRPGVPTQQH